MENAYINLMKQLKKEYGNEHFIFTTWKGTNIYILNGLKYLLVIKLRGKNSYLTSYSINKSLGGLAGEFGKKNTWTNITKVENNVKNILRNHGFKITTLFLSKD